MMYTFIDWKSLELKRSSGKEKIRCKSCDETRTDKKDKSLAIDHDEGFGSCFYCGALTFRDSNKPINNKVYKLPSQEWKNYTELSDNMVKFIEGRKIKQFSIKELGVTEEKYYQPKAQKEVTNITFNYFEGETLVNKKYRDSRKNFTQSAGTKSIFYNINSVIGEKECYIVEGEFDVLALHTHGVKNVISVPNGANDNDDYWANSEPYIKNIEKFIIATDNDTKGKILKEAIAQRLGRYRCEYIEWAGKDANDDLISGEIGNSLESAKKFPVAGTFTVKDLHGGIMNLYNNGLPDTLAPKHSSFGNLKDVFSVMAGHLVTITGIPSHGKSNFVEWYVLNLIKDYGMKASFFSPEHNPMELHQANFIEKAVGKNFWKEVNGIPRITQEDILRYEDWANEKLYLTGPEQGRGANWDWILDKFKEQIYSFGINIFVIDAFNKVELGKGNKIDEINNVLTRLTNFAQVNNALVFLVAHPRKMQQKEDGTYDKPTLYDVSGSADFRNQTHDGFCIHRHFGEDGYTEFVNLKTKMAFQGEIGKGEEFTYDVVNGRYHARHMPATYFDMTKDEEEELMPIFTPEVQDNSDMIPSEIDILPF